MIYLDNNATSPVDPEVFDAVFSSLKRDLGNPSSGHLPGRKAHETVESSRRQVSELLNCTSEEIYFTSGGTESNNLALIGTAMHHKTGHIITSAIEHPSVINPCRHLQSLGFDVTYLPVDLNGAVRVGVLKESLREDTILISVMHSNNETGVLQPLEEIGNIAKERGITFHADAAQTLGKMPFDPAEFSISLLTVVSHKFYGPKGVGALYVKTGTVLKPVLFGAGHERGLRPGTENVPGIVGMAKACEITMRDLKLRVAHTSHLRDLLLQDLKAAISGLSLNGENAARLPNTLNINIPGISSNELVEKLKDSVALSTGSACHSGKVTPSGVLKSMGLSDEEALSSVRLSIGKDNTEGEIKEAAAIISAAVKELRKK